MATQAEIAGHCDLSERQVRDLQKRLGLPSRDADLDTFRVAYIRHLRAVAGRHQVEDGGLNLTQERAMLARVQREKLEIETARLRGQVVDVAEVEKEAFELGRMTRDRILAIPDRLSAVLASTTSERVTRQILLQELRQALESLAGGDEQDEYFGKIAP